MSSDFEVPVSSLGIVSPDVLTGNIEQDVEDCEQFPVLFDGNVTHYHDAEGGYLHQEGVHLVTLIHRVQGKGSPAFREPMAESVEIHAPESVYTLSVTDMTHWDRNYPEEDYAVTLFVDEFRQDKYTFHDELLTEIDKREQEFSYNE
jgi:hypothetical protein